MKKALVILILALFVATGAFAQFTVGGQIWTDFGVNMELGNNFSFADNSSWIFNWNTGNTRIQANYTRADGDVTGWIRWRVNGSVRGEASANVGPGALQIGFQEAIARYSSLDFLNNGNGGIGASALNVHPYIRYRVAGLQIGISEAGKIHNGGFSANPFPGIFAGYDMSVAGINLGIAAAALPAKNGDVTVFPFMANVRAGIGDIGPATIGVNVALYSNPQFGFFAVTGGPGAALTTRIGDTNLLVLEGLLDVVIDLGNANVIATGGVVTNFDSNIPGLAIQGGLCLGVPLVQGFTVYPGLIYNTMLNVEGSADELAVGVSLVYRF